MAKSAQIDSVNHRHEAIADMMLAYPSMQKGEIAQHMGYTQAWMSAVINSDTFKLYYENRRINYNDTLHQETIHRLYELAIKATKKVTELIDSDGIDPRFILDAKDKALHRLGYGPKQRTSGENIGVQNNLYVASPGGLQQARERMDEFHAKDVSEVIDGEVLPSRESDEGGDSETSAGVQQTKALTECREETRNKV